MRLFNLFTATVIFLVQFSDARLDSDEEPQGNQSEDEYFDASSIEPDRLLSSESTVIHSVFRILREQVGIMNSLIEALKGRRSLRTKNSHPSVLDSVSFTVAETKDALNDLLHTLKKAKKLVKSASSSDQTDQSVLPGILGSANRIVLDVIERNVNSIEATCKALEDQKSGMYSRKEKLGKVIGDIPERLHSTLARYESILGQASALQKSIGLAESKPDVIV